MDDVQKSKVRLTHWIDHNLDHLRGYGEVAELMEQRGLTEAAERVRAGMKLIEGANTEFSKALAVMAKLGVYDPHAGESHHDHNHHGHSHDHSE